MDHVVLKLDWRGRSSLVVNGTEVAHHDQSGDGVRFRAGDALHWQFSPEIEADDNRHCRAINALNDALRFVDRLDNL